MDKEKIKDINSFANAISRFQEQLDSSLYYSIRNAQEMLETTVAGTLQKSIEQYQAKLFDPIREFHQSLSNILISMNQVQEDTESIRNTI